MAEQRRGDPEVGTRVRMKETGRTGTVREVLETRGRTLYYVVYDRTSREGPVPLVGETVGEFAVYGSADPFDVLPKRRSASVACGSAPIEPAGVDPAWQTGRPKPVAGLASR